MWDAILEQMDNVIAVLLFVCGYLVSQFIERRKRKRIASIESAKALVTLLGQWQSAMASLSSALRAESTSLEELIQEKAKFDAQRGLAFQADFHINVLREDPLAVRVIESASKIPMGESAEQASHAYGQTAHNIQGAFVNRLIGLKSDDPEEAEAARQQSITYVKESAEEFETWCSAISVACGNFVARRA